MSTDSVPPKVDHKAAMEEAYNSDTNLALCYWQLLEAINLIFNSEKISKSAAAICAPIVEDYLAKVFEEPRDDLAEDKIRSDMQEESIAKSIILNTPQAKVFTDAIIAVPRLDGFTPTPVLQWLVTSNEDGTFSKKLQQQFADIKSSKREYRDIPEVLDVKGK